MEVTKEKTVKVTVEVERPKLNPMGELPPAAPEFPKKPYNRFAGNPPEHQTPQEAYASEMGIEDKGDVNPTLIHETVGGHEPSKTAKK
jgi:hypothetical protein